MELFKSMAGVNITHVPYKGAPQAVTDLIGGQREPDVQLDSAGAAAHQGRAAASCSALPSAKRSPQLPDVPTISEAGVPGLRSDHLVRAARAREDARKQIVARLNDADGQGRARAGIEDRSSKSWATTRSAAARTEFAAFIRAESEKYAKVVKLSGAKVD